VRARFQDTIRYLKTRILGGIYRRFRGWAQRRSMIATMRRFLADQSGATAIEYGLIAAGIALVIISVVNGMGTKLNTKFTSINSSLK
jgi:pilus assembly protein Flp/PilA